jgi:phage terminase large subunit GpA-like protein
LFAALPLIPTVSVSQWSKANRVMSGESSATPGKFASLPMQDDAMDDASDPNVSEFAWCWAAQTAGKSECLNNIVGFFMDADPAPVLLVQPTDFLAKEYSKDRIAPMIRDTPRLSGKVKSPRSRDSGNTTLNKRYPGGSLVLVGANAPAGLAGRPRRVILKDEIDRYPASAGTEGDPCALADARAESFPNAVKGSTSTPTVKGRSRIWKKLEASDYQKWHVNCPRCDGEQVLAWSQVNWPEGDPENAWLECACCKAKLTDADRVAMVRAGRWKATQPFKGIRGRWLNGINTLFRKHKGFKNRLHQMAKGFLDAKAGGPDTLRVWINTFLCECFEEETEASIKPDEALERCEDYTPTAIPEGALILVGSADVQGNRIEAEVSAFGRDEESWAIEKKVFDGDPTKDEVWQQLDEFLLNGTDGAGFVREDGLVMKVERVFVDMQHKALRVLEFCRPRLARGVYPCRGVNPKGRTIPPLLPAKPSRNNRMRVPHWNVGVTVAKTTIYDRLPLPIPGPRTMHFPKGFGYDLDHFRQMTCEKRKTRFTHGISYTVFEKEKQSDRNEALDLAVYRLAALASIGPIKWDKLAENRKAQVPKNPEEEAAAVEAAVNAPAAVEKRVARLPRKNFATGW